MKDKETDSRKQPLADEFTWDDTYEEEHRNESEELFEEPEEQPKERLDLVYPDPVPEKKPAPKPSGKKVRKSYKKGLLFALAAVCVIIVVGVVFSKGFSEMLRYNTSYTLWESGSKMDLAAENTRISGVLDGLILSGGVNGISAYREDESMVWNVSYKMTNPVLKMSGEYAFILDQGGKLALVCGADGIVYQAATQYPILDGSINGKGWITLIGEEGLEHELLVYSNDGTQVLRRMTNGSEDGQPMAAALSEDGKCLVTVYAAYNSNKLSGKVTFFDLSASGGTYTDRIWANFVYPDMLATDLYMEGNRCVVVGDNRIQGYDFSDVPRETWNLSLTNQIQALDFGDGFFAVIYGEDLSHVDHSLENQLILYNVQGEEMYHKSLTSPSYLQAMGELLIYGEGRNYVCIDTKGRSRWFYNALEDVQSFWSLESGKKIVRVSASSIQVMNIVGAEKAGEES